MGDLLLSVQIGLVQHLVAQAHNELIAFLADLHLVCTECVFSDDL
jgi:hypothetical protein